MPITASELAQQESNTNHEPRRSEHVSAYTTPQQLENTLKQWEAMSEPEPEPEPEPEASSLEEPSVSAAEEKVEQQADSSSEEAEPEPAATPAPAEDKRFNRLAKRERELRQREAALAAKVAEQSKPKEEAKEEPTVQEVDRLRQLAKENPLDLLQEFGLTYSDIADQLVKEPNPEKYVNKPEPKAETNSAMEQRVKELEAKIQAQSRQADQAAYETAMGNLLDEIENFVSNSEGKYELVQAKGDYPMVAEVMQRHYHQTNETLSYDAAAQRVESYLEDQMRQFVGNKKLAKMLNLTAETEPVQQETKVTGQKKTLTRKQDVSPQKSTSNEMSDSMSREESLKWLSRNMDLFSTAE